MGSAQSNAVSDDHSFDKRIGFDFWPRSCSLSFGQAAQQQQQRSIGLRCSLSGQQSYPASTFVREKRPPVVLGGLFKLG
jgi:hypothetical protein